MFFANPVFTMRAAIANPPPNNIKTFQGISLNHCVSNITLKFLSVGIIKKSDAHIIAILESVRFKSRKELIFDLKIHKKAVDESIIDVTFSLIEKLPSDLYFETIRVLSIPVLSFLDTEWS